MSGTRHVSKTGLQGIEHIGLVGLDLEQVIATLGLQQFQQRALGVDGVARKKPQSGVGRQEFRKVVLEASWFIRFVAADGPLIQRHLGLLQKDIEHLHGRPVGGEPLATRFSVDGGSPSAFAIAEHRLEPKRERTAKLLQGKPGQCAGNRRVAGGLFPGKTQWSLQLIPMSRRPPHDHGHFRNACQQSQEYKRNNTWEWMANPPGLARIGHLREHRCQTLQCRDHRTTLRDSNLQSDRSITASQFYAAAPTLVCRNYFAVLLRGRGTPLTILPPRMMI